MEPSDFRRDPWLRSCGYHLATWSLVALVLELRRLSAPAPGGLAPAGAVVIVGAAVLTSLTHERRIGKMAGPALVPVWDGAGRLWSRLLAAFAAGGAVLAGTGHAEALVALGLAILGAGFVVWGSFVRMAWLQAVGSAAIAAAMADVGILIATGGPSAVLRAFVLGVVLPGAGVLTSRRYLWFRRTS